MNKFPRTTVGGVSLSRMIIGTNWFLGFSHCTKSKDDYITSTIKTVPKMADILEVFFRSGVDTIMGQIATVPLVDAIREAEQRTGVKAIIVSTPSLPSGPETPTKGFDLSACARILDLEAKLGATFCMPHTSITDNMVDRCARRVRKMDQICALIRERGMIPGLSTHMPEAIIYSDESGLDVETYISLYNAMGFLMQLEVDWTASIIQKAKKPVMTIKPMAAGQIRPFQAFNFVWNTIRPQDMVTVGTMSPDEAKEDIEMSLSIIEHRKTDAQLQQTRSKASVTTQKPAK